MGEIAQGGEGESGHQHIVGNNMNQFEEKNFVSRRLLAIRQAANEGHIALTRVKALALRDRKPLCLPR